MKLMQVSFNIDVCNADHVAALHNFMNVLGDHSAPTATVAPTPAPAEPKKAKAVKEKPEPVKEEPQESTSELIDETTPTKEELSAVDHTMLRTTVSELVRGNGALREVILAKLAEFEVTRVSDLAVKHYDTFYSFLKTLA